jgi:hypothetical protein
MIDRNLGYKIIEALTNTVKLVTIVDFHNLKLEIEQIIVSLNSINLKSKAQVIYILPDLLSLLSVFLNGDSTKITDAGFFTRFAYINTKQIRSILKKYEVESLGSKAAGIGSFAGEGSQAGH